MHVTIAAPLLTRWVNFYVIAGSAAASLTGLQFVVVAIVSQMRALNMSAGFDAFSTPTVVYFSTVLLLSAVLAAPWEGLWGAATLISICGAAGIGYAALVGWRARRLTSYRLVFEDWLWHIALPLASHTMLLAGGLMLLRRPPWAMVTIAAAVLLLLFIGIHNAWDTVTFLVTQRLDEGQRDKDRQEPPSA